MICKCKSWFHRSKVHHEIEFPKTFPDAIQLALWYHFEYLRVRWPSSEFIKPLALPMSPSVYAAMTLFSSSYWTTASHIVNPDDTSAPMWAFCKLSTSIDTATPLSWLLNIILLLIIDLILPSWQTLSPEVKVGIYHAPLSFRIANQE